MHVKNGDVDQWRKVRRIYVQYVYFDNACFCIIANFGFWAVCGQKKQFEDVTFD